MHLFLVLVLLQSQHLIVHTDTDDVVHCITENVVDQHSSSQCGCKVGAQSIEARLMVLLQHHCQDALNTAL